jgi:hypothetical protein
VQSIIARFKVEVSFLHFPSIRTETRMQDKGQVTAVDRESREKEKKKKKKNRLPK